MANKFRLKEKAAAVDKAFREMVIIAANDAQCQFKKNFDTEGFLDESIERWPERKKETRKSRGKKILYNTGKLKRSIRISFRQGGLSARVFTVLPYAAIHNEGGMISGRELVLNFRGTSTSLSTGKTSVRFTKARGRGVNKAMYSQKVSIGAYRMPQRKYLGASRNLERRTMAKFNAKTNTAFLNG